MCVLLGVARGDTTADAERLAGKVANLRIFENHEGKFDRSLLDSGGAALVVSNFTLIADTSMRKGNRPDFSHAAPRERAEPLYERFCQALRDLGVQVEAGVFGARMAVEIVNDGPVTIVLDTQTEPLERGRGVKPRRPAKPTLDAVLANVARGRSHRLRLSPEQKCKLHDRDGLLVRQIIRALQRAREHAVAPSQPRHEFPATEHAVQAIARKLGHPIGQKRARLLIARALDAGIIREAGSYRQTYRLTGASGHRVKLYEINVRMSARIGELRTALRLKPLSAKESVSRRQAGVPWYLHPLFGTPDGLPPPCHDPVRRRRLKLWRERKGHAGRRGSRHDPGRACKRA